MELWDLVIEIAFDMVWKNAVDGDDVVEKTAKCSTIHGQGGV
jgi:hypothetical protein